MPICHFPRNQYLLLTPGPLSTTQSVKKVMLQDWCTWDEDYNRIVQHIREKLLELATPADGYTTVLMQGSGTFGVEAVITSVIPENGKILVLANGAYGNRMAQIAARSRIPLRIEDSGETHPLDPDKLADILGQDTQITHVAVVHCETTTGMLNPIADIGRTVKSFGKIFIVDAMSSFGGIPMDIVELQVDYLISSANKCIQGVPGFSFVIARRKELEKTRGWARTMSLDLYDQWETMEHHNGKWRFTSPTHVVRAFYQALKELHDEGGVEKRHQRYRENQQAIVSSMRGLGFSTLLADAWQSPIITAFHSPEHPEYDFRMFYSLLKSKGFVIYPGKVTDHDTFRIGNIGEIYPHDIHRLMSAVKTSLYWKSCSFSQPGEK